MKKSSTSQKIIFCIFVFLSCNLNLIAQLHYGGPQSDYGYHLAHTSDHGYVLCGTYQSGADNFLYVIKIDQYGTVQWSKLTGQNCGASCISQTLDGGYIIMGSAVETVVPYFARAMLLKLDSNGDSLWSMLYGNAEWGDNGTYCNVTPSGEYILGMFSDDMQGYNPITILKTDTTGSQLLSVVTNGHATGGFVSQTIIADSNYFINASTDVSYGPSQISVSKLDNQWNFIFQKLYEDTTWDSTFTYRDYIANGVCEGLDGKILVVGQTDKYSIPHYDYKFYYMLLDSSGDSLWSRYIDTYPTGNNMMMSARPCADGGFVMVGNTDVSGTSQNHIVLFRINSDGDTLWTRDYGAALEHYVIFMDTTEQGGFILIGDTLDSLGNTDVWLMITDSLGNTISSGNVGLSQLNQSSKRIKLFPQPVKDFFNIEYSLIEGSHVQAEIYDAKGRLVKKVLDEIQAAGTYQKTFFVALLPGYYSVTILKEGLISHLSFVVVY